MRCDFGLALAFALALAGCDRPPDVTQTESGEAPSDASSPVHTRGSDKRPAEVEHSQFATDRALQFQGESIAVTGRLQGGFIRLQSNKILEVKDHQRKGPSALELYRETGSLSLMPATEEIGNALVENTGHDVELRGVMQSAQCQGRGLQQQQQGYTGPIPDHWSTS